MYWRDLMYALCWHDLTVVLAWLELDVHKLCSHDLMYKLCWCDLTVVLTWLDITVVWRDLMYKLCSHDLMYKMCWCDLTVVLVWLNRVTARIFTSFHIEIRVQLETLIWYTLMRCHTSLANFRYHYCYTYLWYYCQC